MTKEKNDMTKDQQDLAWACLPKETRDKVISVYACKSGKHPYDEGYKDALRQLYGHHNLISDTEPEEMLMVARSNVIRKYKFADICDKDHPDKKYWDGAKYTLTKLFGDKCLPDKEQPPKPKFNKGERVKIADERVNTFGCIATITHCEVDNGKVFYWLDDNIGCYMENQLESYTDGTETKRKEAQNLSRSDEKMTDTMEEKELNLCELLKGCEGETFYSRAYGEVRLNEIVRDDRLNSQEIKVYTRDPQSDRIWFLRDGRKHKNGEIDLYPSRALYEKYPLDPAKAWAEWKEARKQKRILQVEIRLISNDGKSIEDYEEVNMEMSDIDLTQAAEAVREALAKFHQQKQKGE